MSTGYESTEKNLRKAFLNNRNAIITEIPKLMQHTTEEINRMQQRYNDMSVFMYNLQHITEIYRGVPLQVDVTRNDEERHDIHICAIPHNDRAANIYLEQNDREFYGLVIKDLTYPKDKRTIKNYHGELLMFNDQKDPSDLLKIAKDWVAKGVIPYKLKEKSR